MSELKYLELLSKNFRNIAETSTEIINLEAILNLPRERSIFFQMCMVSMRLLHMYLETVQEA